jgi:hypothetical protein
MVPKREQPMAVSSWKRSIGDGRVHALSGVMLPINRKLSRRDVIEALSLAGGAFVAGCASSPTSATSTATTSSTTTTSATSGTAGCAVTAEETAGPYPDRTGMIGNSSFFGQDITEGRSGLPLTLALAIANVRQSCAAGLKACTTTDNLPARPFCLPG